MIQLETTFEFARNLLASSRTFRDVVLAEYNLEVESEARDHIYRQEALDEPNSDEDAENFPSLSPQIYPIPRAIIISQGSERRFVGTGSWAGSGTLLFIVEALVPQSLRSNHAKDNVEALAEKFGQRNRWAEHTAERVRSEMLQNRGGSDGAGNHYLAALTIDISEPPAESAPEEPDPFFGWEYNVTWS